MAPRKRKPASKRGIDAPTGMETLFADAPLTPAAYADAQKLFDKTIAPLDRILTAIESFEQTRKLTPERRDVFYKWLHYGGVKIASNAFSSGLLLDESSKEEINSAKSKIRLPDYVRKAVEGDEDQDPDYVVDFLGCTRAFFSYRAPVIYYFDTKADVDRVTSIIERFMDYLLQHDVCPEYADDILATRNFCRKAVDELWSVREAQSWLPGDFNIACSTLFGGSHSKMYDGKTLWGATQPGESGFVGFTPEQATQIVGLGIVGAASEDVYSRYAELVDQDNGAGFETAKVFTGAGFEIVEIEYPTVECKEMYKKNTNEYRPVGRVLAKPWKSPLTPPEDLTEEEKAAPKNPISSEPYVFFMEEIIQRNLSVGQKVMATVQQLNCGVWFFDEFTVVYPNFELWIPNDLVEDYKEPRMLAGAYVPRMKLEA